MRRTHLLVTALLLVTTFVAAQRKFEMDPKLYDSSADASKEIAASLQEAKKDQKRVILVYGGNWCFDCHVLNYWFHEPGIVEIVDQNYHVVHVDIGKFDKNLDLADKYGVTIKKGVPAIAILSPAGKTLFSDTTGQFENAREMKPNDIAAFLNKWKK